MLGITRKSRIQRKQIESEKDQRLQKAESDLALLKARAARALNRIEIRQSHNHWRESIQSLIQGAP